MDFELRAAKQKWDREQQEKKEKARARQERERRAKEEAIKRQEAIETAQRIRRLEEAAAAQAARQQEQDDLEVGDGVLFNRVLQVIPTAGDGDKIRLPASAFEELSNQSAIDKGPMFFEVSAVSQPGRDSVAKLASTHMEDEGDEAESPAQGSTHAGVLEFTAVEGFAELPPHVWRNAGFNVSGGVTSDLVRGPFDGGVPQARIRYVRLPKGTYVRLQAEGGDFADVPNHKAVLETKLRQHASLSKGDLLQVQHGGIDYGLRVLELQPQGSVSVLETDLEVDVIGPVDKDASPQSRLAPLMLGKPEAGTVEEGQYTYFKFTIDSQTEKAIGSSDLDIVVLLDVENQGGVEADADLYVSAHPLLFPTQHQHQWSSHDMGSKVVCLTTPEKSLGTGISREGKSVSAGSYSVGVYGFRGFTKFKLRVETKVSVSKVPHGQRLSSNLGDGGSSAGTSSNSTQPDAGFERCENCKQLIPARTLVLHEAYCRRHNVTCQHPDCGVVLRRGEMEKHVHCSKCGEGFTREELGKHMKVFHEPLKCGCGEVLEMEEMVKHRATSCPQRLITCRFCGDLFQAGTVAENMRDRLRGLTHHESSCGARTAACDTCGRAIMLKEMDLHRAAAHGGQQSMVVSASANRGLVAGSIGQKTSIFSADASPEANWAGSLMADHTANQVAGLAVNQVINQAANHMQKQMECPICGIQFGGADGGTRLNLHLDNEHFSPQASAGMDIDTVPSTSSIIPTHTESTTRRTLSVSCPICGMAVHSERDLSSHIDLVH